MNTMPLNIAAITIAQGENFAWESPKCMLYAMIVLLFFSVIDLLTGVTWFTKLPNAFI